KELVLRVKALLRRYGAVSENKIQLPHTELNYSTNTVVINGQGVELTKKEFQLLFKLLSNPNMIFSREQLINEIWGFDSESSDRTVDTHIKCIRSKTENEDFKIVTVRGLGYKAVIL
ncbi:MAG: winged helix-turn-helix domain-containing protein, partial [Oscillospiraceae bacterium]